MNNGFYLSLMIGPLEPLPASCEVIEALTSVQVTTTTEGPSVFQLSFTLSTKSPLHTLFLLSGGSLPPIMRVIIVVTVNGSSEVLMDGVMTNHEVTPGSDLGHATLTISGEDLTRLMDYIDLTGFPFPAMPDYARVTAILAKYAFLGIVPLVIPSVLMDIPIPTERIPMQKGKDLEYIQQLADESGYVFYIDPGPVPGMSTAYWGPEIKVGLPQPALNINMDAYTNVESLNFSFNSEKKTMPVIFVQYYSTQSSSWLDCAISQELRNHYRRRKALDDKSCCHWSGKSCQDFGCRIRLRKSECAEVRPCSEGEKAGRSKGRGSCLRRSLLRKKRNS
jgi:hypothetical protein